MKCKNKTDKFCCRVCECISNMMSGAADKLKGTRLKNIRNKRGFVFSLDAFFAVIIAMLVIGATSFMLSNAQKDYFRELQMANIANDALIILEGQDLLEDHNKSLIKYSLIEILPTNLGARLRITPYECKNPECTEFDISSEIPPYEIVKGSQTPVDVMIVMDTSSSMSDGPKEENCFEWWCIWFYDGCDWCTGGIGDSKDAAIEFLDFLYFEKDRSGLATFGTNADLEQSLTSDKSALISEINAIDVPCSCDDIEQTALGDGIAIANQEFQTNGRPNAEWVQIVLSDGKANTGQDPLDAAQDAADENITIYTIGLGSDADGDTLQQIAELTGGEYYYSPAGDDLITIYTKIVYEIFKISEEVVTGRSSFLTMEDINVKYYCEAEMGIWLI